MPDYSLNRTARTSAAQGRQRCQHCSSPSRSQGPFSLKSAIWQQNSAPCHTNRKTQFQLSENFYNHIIPNIWLHNSSDCNPLDYYVQGVVEQETNKTLCDTKGEQKATIMTAFSNLNKGTVRKGCRKFQSCLESK